MLEVHSQQSLQHLPVTASSRDERKYEVDVERVRETSISALTLKLKIKRLGALNAESRPKLLPLMIVNMSVLAVQCMRLKAEMHIRR